MSHTEAEYQRQQRLIERLLQPRAYLHPVAKVERLETHISWILLAGDYAYKIKKSLDLGFLDYTTLPRRHHFCTEEVRLNGRTAPDLYLGVSRICGPADAPVIDGDGETLEYAVRMRRFDQGQELDRRLAAGEVTTAELEELARFVARFHDAAPAADPESDFGTPEQVRQPVGENFTQIAERLQDEQAQLWLTRLRKAAERRFERLRPLLESRRASGAIRECHGDLHLGNILLTEEGPALFDGIEFNPHLRWIDVINDLAFLLMDLEARQRPDLAWRVLNHYLEWRGDHAALALLPWYLAYRAMVRAKVAVIRWSQCETEQERQRLREEYRSYLALAERAGPAHSPFLLITHGLSGSGKTTRSQPLIDRLGAIRIRSDVERKRLFGLAPDADSGSALATGIYTPEASARTYARLLELAEMLLAAGFPVIADATFLAETQRRPFRALAERLRIPFIILHCRAPLATLEARIERRDGDASEADHSVLARQQSHAEPLTAEEARVTVTLDSEAPPDGETLLHALAPHLERG